MNHKSIDVNYEDVSKKYYTIDEVSNILNIEQSTIAFYFEKLNDFLNITSVGMYQLFDDIDIKNLKKIKDLEQNQNMSMQEIKKHLLKNKQEVILEKESNTQVDKSVLNIFQQFANALMEQNIKIDEMNKTNVKLVNIISNLSENQKKMQQELKEQKELNQKQLDEYDKNSKKLDKQLESVKKEIGTDIESKLNNQNKEFNNGLNNMSNKIIEDNNKTMDEFKYLTLEQIKTQKETKGFFNRLFMFNKKE
jgi:DNA-binding transcriptional MerR regulator